VTTATKLTFAAISTIVAVAGVLAAYAIYAGVTSATEIEARDRRLGGPAYQFVFDKWRWDELYDRILVQPARGLATMLWQVVDIGLIDATVNGVATASAPSASACATSRPAWSPTTPWRSRSEWC
jgi:NADH-quinone oxidoreductase subunit L